MAISIKKIDGFWNNPVIARDMRVRLRGGRAFVNQALYLIILSLIAMFGYAMATNIGQRGVIDPVEAQQSLRQFYYFIFTTLAGLVAVIAPALTAVAIVSERQRLTLDLLVTTPMTAIQMLTGKLLSSLAFLLLLLILSLPLSSLCVMLGGATISDVAQAYFFLTTDGLVFAAIGLAFSCTAKNNSQAILYTYGAVILLVIVTAMSAPYGLASAFMGRSSAPLPLCSVLSVLCPFVVSLIPSATVSVFSLNVPLWVASGIVNLLLVRVILTGAALRIGMYGPTLVRSLRLQILLLTLFGGYLLSTLSASRFGGGSSNDALTTFIIWFGVFCFAALFFPALMGPHIPDDEPAGATFTTWYSPRKAFSTAYEGALPYFHMWLTCFLGGTLIGSAFTAVARVGASLAATAYGTPGLPSGGGFDTLCDITPAVWLYFSGLGFLVWSLARRSAWVTSATGPARAMTFLVFAFILAAPGLILLTSNQLHETHTNDASLLCQLWLLAPLNLGNDQLATTGPLTLARSALLAYALGTVIYPFWLRVTPGAGARGSARTAKGAG